MKKIYLSLLLAAGFLFTSCDMDLEPVGSLNDEDAIQSVLDLEKARNGIYNNVRSFCTGGLIYYTDIQMDQFLGLVINGNNYGSFAHGNILSGNSDITSVWAACYSNIADANYLLGAVDEFIEKYEPDSDDMVMINRYVAETKFARAFYYYYLFDHFCESYTAAKGDVAAKGLPLVTKFAPTADITTYPGRSTMNETFALIDKDLEDAYAGLTAFEEADDYVIEPMDFYVNSYVVRALQCRLALLRQNWEKAIELANEIIDSKIYTLQAARTYAQMWTTDTSNELIFRPISTDTELGISSMSTPYISANQQSAYYIPTNQFLSMYDKSLDQRYKAFFTTYNIVALGEEYPATVFNKYPGNPNLATTSSDLYNMGKPFRLSETYLILAEASYEMNDEATANSALTTLRKARYTLYTGKTYSGEELRDEIRAERTKELIGEGFRMSDLRRWGLGFTRDGSYPNPDIEALFVVQDKDVEYIPGDYRYVWPIPTAELENNPQIRGQQNPGY